MQNVQTIPSDFADLPIDYEECGTCGFDHEYEPAEAAKAHPPEPRFNGFKTFDESSTLVYQVFDREVVEKFLGYTVTAETADDCMARLTGWYGFSRGVGKAFGQHPNIRINKRSIMITQWRGLDI